MVFFSCSNMALSLLLFSLFSPRFMQRIQSHKLFIHHFYPLTPQAFYSHEYIMDLNCLHLHQHTMTSSIELDHQFIVVSLLPSNTSHNHLHKFPIHYFHLPTCQSFYLHENLLCNSQTIFSFAFDYRPLWILF